MKVLITYKVKENDSSWMSSRENENESHTIDILTKQDVLNFLKSLEYVTINEEIYKELESDNDFTINEELDKIYSDREDQDWISTDFVLRIKSIK